MVDGTYYLPDEQGQTLVPNSGVWRQMAGVLTLAGGSGTATATIEAQDSGGTWVDITTTFYPAGIVAQSGQTKRFPFVDDSHQLAPFVAFRLKAVLDTGGTGDAQASVAWNIRNG